MPAPTESIEISAMTDGAATQATDVVPVWRGAGNARLALSSIKTFVLNGLSLAWGSITGTPTTLAGYGITDAASDSELSAHEADTTNVHGIADTAALATTAALAAHEADTTAVHGIANTANLLTTSSAAGGDMSGTLDNLQIGAGAVGTTELAGDAVTYAKMQNVSASDKVLGRISGAGDVEEIAFTAAMRALADDATVAAQRQTLDVRRQPSRSFVQVGPEDFVSAQPFVTSTGSGGAVGLNDAANSDPGGYPGWCILQTTTNAAARAAITPAPGQSILLGYGDWTFDTIVRVPTLSDGTETFVAYIGFGDSATGNPTDGVLFRYTHSVNSGKWECVTRANNVETVSDSGVAVVAGTIVRLGITINAAATSVTFTIDGATVATITTNIPTGAGRQTGLVWSIIKSAGTTNRRLDVDYLDVYCELTTAR